MLITQKSQYGLRAVFELAKRKGQGPVKIHDIAESQSIPQRFLEGILNQLRQSGIVESRRGKNGGYFLTCSPEDLSVDRIIEILDGPINLITCVKADGSTTKECDLYGNCVFLSMWEEAREAILKVYQDTSFQKLLDKEKSVGHQTNFSI